MLGAITCTPWLTVLVQLDMVDPGTVLMWLFGVILAVLWLLYLLHGQVRFGGAGECTFAFDQKLDFIVQALLLAHAYGVSLQKRETTKLQMGFP